MRSTHPILSALSIVPLVDLGGKRTVRVSLDRGTILVLDVKAMVQTTHLRRSAIDAQTLEHVAHLFLEITEVVSVLVVFVSVKPAPLLELVLEVAVPRTLKIGPAER